MTADSDPIDDAAWRDWLQLERAALDPARSLMIRGVDGRIVAVLPRNGREVEDDLARHEPQ